MFQQIDMAMVHEDEPLINIMDIQSQVGERSLNGPSPLFVALSDYSPKTPLAVPRGSYSLSPPQSLSLTPRRRPSSPLRPIYDNSSDPIYDNGCQSPHSQAPIMSSSPSSINPLSLPGPSTTAQHRMSISGRPRRPSPLLHEIQPPSRRLSAHQMLLLTPFGGSVPAGALSGGAGMSRGSSSMGSAAGPLPTAPARLGSETERSAGWPRRESGHGAVMAAPPLTGMGMSMSREPHVNAPRAGLRIRHSLANPTTYGYGMAPGPSPLASAPMTTIPSNSETESSLGSSRGPSRDRIERNTTFMSRDEISSASGDPNGVSQLYQPSAVDIRAIPRLIPSNVEMTRSNSLPVLTLRELQAMKEKDGELGIQRGGNWAWVSRESPNSDNNGDLDEHDASGKDAGFALSSPSSSSHAPVPSPTSVTVTLPESRPRQPFTHFQDPFAPRSTTIANPTATSLTSDTAMVIPPSTSSDYHYSPSAHDGRRQSEAPLSAFGTGTSPEAQRRAALEARRPSAPAVGMHNALGSMTPRGSNIAAPSYQPPVLKVGEISPGGTPLEPLPSRPKITRYKTSPARFTGLGLNIVVRSTNEPPSAGTSTAAPSAGPSSAGSRAERRPVNGEAGPSRNRNRTASTSTPSGQWAEVDFVDPHGAATDISHPISSSSSINISPTARRSQRTSSGSISIAGRSSRRSSGRASVMSAFSSAPVTIPGYTIETITSRSHISGFESSPTSSFKGRSRFESVDSAFPLMPGGSGGRLSVPHVGAGEGYHDVTRVPIDDFSPTNMDHDGFPRRSSLGVGTFAKLRRAMSPWLKDDIAKELGAHAHSTRSSGSDAGRGRRLVAVEQDEKSRPRHWSERRGSWAESWQRAR